MRPHRYMWNSLGLPLAYHIWEPAVLVPPERPTVVLLHGYLDHARSFDPVAAAVAARYRVVAPDLRGHGESGHIGPGGYYHFPDYLLDLHRLIEHLKLESAIIAGHSMGASIACYFAGAYPDRTRALALLDGIGPAAVPAERSPALLRRWVNDVRLSEARGATLETMESLDEVARRIGRMSPGASPERLLAMAETATLKTEGGWRWRFDPLHRTTAPMAFDVVRFRVFLQAIRCPALIVWGERSPMRPPDAEERMALLGNLTRLVLPEAAHNLHHERPAELARALLGFFDEACA